MLTNIKKKTVNYSERAAKMKKKKSGCFVEVSRRGHLLSFLLMIYSRVKN